MHGTIGHSAVRVHRVVRRHSDWTLKEHEVVVSHWPDVDKIAKQLPHRTRNAIRSFAGKCNLRKQIHSWTQEEHSLLRRRVREGISQREIAKELGLTKLQVTNRMRYAGLTYGRRPPTPSGNKIMDAIFYRAFELNLSRKDLDALCQSRAAFSRWSPARRIHNRHIWRAVKELGGQLVVEWCDE